MKYYKFYEVEEGTKGHKRVLIYEGKGMTCDEVFKMGVFEQALFEGRCYCVEKFDMILDDYYLKRF